MNKLVYLILIGIIVYLMYNQIENKSTEGFENISLSSADDQNSVNVLAQIAKSLMAGGATVPGNLNIKDNLTVGANTNITGTSVINGKLTVNGGADITGALLSKGDITTSGNTTMNGKLTANKGIDVTGALNNNGNATITGDATITGTTSLTGPLNVNNQIKTLGRTITPSLFKIWPMSRNATDCMKAFDNNTIALDVCNNNDPKQLWYWNGQQIRSSDNDLCLTAIGNWGATYTNSKVILSTCKDGERSQNWKWRDDHRLRNMALSGPLRLPNNAASNKASNYSNQSQRADIWDFGCQNDCELWFG